MSVQPKKSSRLFILLGVVLTLVSMIGVYFIANGSSKSASSGTTQVLVAARMIPPHTVFTKPSDAAAWFTVQTVPSTAVPANTFSSVAAFGAAELGQGRVLSVETIFPKEEILGSLFNSLGQRQAYTSALSLPKNDVAVSLESTIANESGGAISPGDYVDIVASYLPHGGGTGGGAVDNTVTHPPQTQFVLQNIKVVAVGNWVPGTTETSVASSGSTMLTFAVDRRTALVIQHLKDFGGSWSLSVMLRSAYSSRQYKTYPVDPTWFFRKLRNNFER